VGRVRVVVDSSNNNNNNNDHAEEPKGLVFGTYEALRNMEMVVVARVLMRPEPSLVERRSGSGSSSGEESGGFYVSKAWCRSALRWLECQAMERRDREVVRLNNLEEEEEERARVAAAAGASGGRKGKHHHHHHQQRKAKNNNNGGGGKKNKKSKRKERIQNRKKSDALPPSPYVNYDLLCEHGRLRSKCSSNNNNTINNNHTPNGNNNNNNSNNNINGGGSRAKRRLMDRQAWRVLKKLYPDGVQLSSIEGECLQCALEEQTAKRNEDVRKGKETEERKKPLGCRLVRGFYTRNRGVPMARLTVGETMTTTGGRSDSSALASTMVVGKKGPSFRNGSTCPLLPGIYNVLPRSWCHRWRKYIKTGEGGRPCAPDTSACLCDEHKLPLIPTHLESYLYGETSSLLHSNGFVVSSSNSAMVGSIGGGGGEAGGSGSRGSSGGSSGSDIGTLAGLERMTVSSSRPLPQSIVGLNPIEQRTVAQRPISASSSSSTQRNNNDHDSMLDDLRASGLSIAEIETQRQMMHQLEEWRREQSVAYEHHHHAVASATTPTTATTSNSTTTIITSPPPTIMMSPEERRANDSAQLDRENNVVVEILTDEELTALMRWWPDVHSSYSLKFAIVESEEGGGNMDVVWTTSPCRHCDKTGRASHVEVVVRNRCRSWVGNSPAKKK